jgi:MYXO-CTERM domain-containing protein
MFFSVVPVPGSTLPANATALGVNRTLYSASSWDGGSARVVLQSTLSIRSGDGGIVGWSDGGTDDEPWAILDDALVEGDELWVEATTNGCESAGRISIGPAAPLPQGGGELAVANFEFEENARNPCGGPTGRVEHAQLTFDPPADLVPWMPLTRWELEVDGTNYATSGFGGAGVDTPSTGMPARSGMHPVLTLHAQCGPSAPEVGPALDARLMPGPHQVRLLGRTVGRPTPLSTNTVMVDFKCQPTGCACASSSELGVVALLLALLTRRRRATRATEDRSCE